MVRCLPHRRTAIETLLTHPGHNSQMLSREEVIGGASGRHLSLLVPLLLLLVLGTGCATFTTTSGSSGAPPSGASSGDPAGRIMTNLTPLVRVLPGFESGAVPWIAPPCDSCQFPHKYAIKIEPRWDRCDGRSGTYGWDPVTIQIGFPWSGSQSSLNALIAARLLPLGWQQTEQAPDWGDAGSPAWTFPAGPSPTETITASASGSGGPMAFIQALPRGKLVGGC
jgi:hypothetical protein